MMSVISWPLGFVLIGEHHRPFLGRAPMLAIIPCLERYQPEQVVVPHPFPRRAAVADAAPLVEGMEPPRFRIEIDVEQLVRAGPAVVARIVGEKLLGDDTASMDK